MKEIIALQELIETNESRVKLFRKQLSEHEAGTKKMTPMILASAESNLEEVSELLEKHKEMLNNLLQQDLQELEKEEAIKEAIRRKNYYHYQHIRLKRNKTASSDEKLEAMMIVDELPTGVEFEDKDIFELAIESLSLSLREHDVVYDKLDEIKKDFEELTKDLEDEDIKSLGLLNVHIPILVLHFSILAKNVSENTIEDIHGIHLVEFHGFPKFEDWWISELWTSHQAYFGLYKWKSIISNQCLTTEQKYSWEAIFSNWIFIKKLINRKGDLAFHYNYAFDSLLKKHAHIEEELLDVNLVSMETIVKNMTAKEDFNTVVRDHNIVTPYLKFKREQEKS